MIVLYKAIPHTKGDAPVPSLQQFALKSLKWHSVWRSPSSGWAGILLPIRTCLLTFFMLAV